MQLSEETLGKKIELSFSTVQHVPSESGIDCKSRTNKTHNWPQ